jgi:large subunit ribosomal protein L44e
MVTQGLKSYVRPRPGGRELRPTCWRTLRIFVKDLSCTGSIWVGTLSSTEGTPGWAPSEGRTLAMGRLDFGPAQSPDGPRARLVFNFFLAFEAGRYLLVPFLRYRVLHWTMVNIPKVAVLCERRGRAEACGKTRRTYCKGKACKKHTPHKVTQYKAGKASAFAQGKRRYDRKQSGYGGQTKPVFHKSSPALRLSEAGVDVCVQRPRRPRRWCCGWSARPASTRCVRLLFSCSV